MDEDLAKPAALEDRGEGGDRIRQGDNSKVGMGQLPGKNKLASKCDCLDAKCGKEHPHKTMKGSVPKIGMGGRGFGPQGERQEKAKDFFESA